MKELRFDGRVAVITGAGGNPGLGRAHAMLLASRGAKVVVNDIGMVDEGGELVPKADLVVEEIVKAGGVAVADTNSVVGAESATALIRTAIDTFGRIDILVNNAGIGRIAELDVMTATDIELMLDVHVRGCIYVTRAAWPFMREAGYGRIVNTTSSGFHGLPKGAVYGAAKGATFAFTRSLAIDGEPFGILSNSVEPAAWSGLFAEAYGGDRPLVQSLAESPLMRAELVSPTVAYLAHESCPVNGECVQSELGSMNLVQLQRTVGISELDPTLESVRERWAEIVDQDGATVIPYTHSLGLRELADGAPYSPREASN